MKKNAFKLRKQQGAALFIALVALATMAVAGIALVRSMDTSTLLAGNLTYRQATVQAAELGIEDAISYLVGKKTYQALDNFEDVTNGRIRYISQALSVDSFGIPDVNWDSEVFQLQNPLLLNTNAYQVSYVIDRLCRDRGVSDPHIFCQATGSSSQIVNYRITVRVTGPRNSESFVQTIYRF